MSGTGDKDKNKGAGTGAAGGEGEGEGNPDPTEGTGAGEGEGGAEDFSDPEKAKAEIKKLRAENAKHRTKNKSLEAEIGTIKGTMGKMKQALGLEDEADPEQQIAQLKAQNESLQFETALSEVCREQDIPRGSEKYFKFLLAQEFEALDEGEEISEERIIELAAEAKKVSGGGNPANNSTGAGGGKKPNPSGTTDTITAEQFGKMNSGQRSELYVKNPNLYQKLFEEAKTKKLL